MELKRSIVDSLMRNSTDEEKVILADLCIAYCDKDSLKEYRDEGSDNMIKYLRDKIKKLKPSSLNDQIAKTIAFQRFYIEVDEYDSIEKIEISERKKEYIEVWIEYADDQGWCHEWDTRIKRGEEVVLKIR